MKKYSPSKFQNLVEMEKFLDKLIKTDTRKIQFE